MKIFIGRDLFDTNNARLMNRFITKFQWIFLSFFRTVQSNLRKVQLTNKEEISTSTHNHHQEKTNGYTLVRILEKEIMEE
jgi:hypothetical protein